ncbi:MAG: hypothetical protein FJX02_09350 [Alphaproteobacteria bacterium]|nr:hypothetical protein [Alphaproteobacteria bacterium]
MPTAYLAAEGFERQLVEELARAGVAQGELHGRLLVSDAPAIAAAWAVNIWRDVEEVPIASIGAAASALRARGRNWAVYAPLHAGRAKLIAERLPHVSAKALALGAPAPTAPLGSWTLLATDRLLLSADCTSPFPNGEARFVEDRAGPPNRAYLKLWEALAVARAAPGPGARCLDLGASPGGWSWSLARLGASVVAVDKAPLDPRVAALPNVTWRGESAFALDPATLATFDWLVCDIACYPARLLTLVERWRAAGTVRRFVCTLKFQGATDHATAEAFAALPGARLHHLHHNKHELTLFIS